MPHRIDIELTSTRDDGTWTWRAAGARQPKGVLEGSVLHAGAKVGDVLRAEADFEVDGITILSVLPPKAPRAEAERLELLGSGREEPSVRLFAAGPRSDRPRRERRDRDGDRGRDGGERRDRRGPGRPDGGRGDRPGPGARTGGDGAGRERRGRPDGDRGPVGERGPSGARERAPRREAPAPAPKPKPKRLQPGRAHRDAALETLAPEHRAIAEQVLKGGIPAVRRGVDEENERAKAEGRPEVKAEPIVAIAEELLPGLRAAEWRDRAEAAVEQAGELALRDLRAVVTGAETSVRDDAGRELAARLREALDQRLAQLRDDWIGEVTRSLDDGRVVRALRISGRPPEPGTRFPAEIQTRLTEAAGAALAPDTTAQRWLAVLEAVVTSPVRRTVTPAGLPAEAPEEMLETARRAAPRVPGLAALLGIEPAKPAGPSRRPPRRPPSPEELRRRVVPPGAPSAPRVGDTLRPAATEPATAEVGPDAPDGAAGTGDRPDDAAASA